MYKILNILGGWGKLNFSRGGRESQGSHLLNETLNMIGPVLCVDFTSLF